MVAGVEVLDRERRGALPGPDVEYHRTRTVGILADSAAGEHVTIEVIAWWLSAAAMLYLADVRTSDLRGFWPSLASAMKSILIPIQDHDAMPAVLEGARLVAHAFDSYMEGFAVRPSAESYVNFEPVSGLAIQGVSESEWPDQARRQFESFMQTHGVPPAEQLQVGYSYGWPHAETVDESLIGSRSRAFDLIVLGRPGSAPKNPRMPPLETALFDSGRPVLIVPAPIPQTLGHNVLVAWNGSTEQTRTNAFAIPILQLAGNVTVLTVEGVAAPGPSGEEAALYLRRHGIKSTALTVNPGTHTPGEVILAQASSLGCDLLVKGAYTQSRLRQMIFGGATRHILANATLPVLMAH